MSEDTPLAMTSTSEKLTEMVQHPETQQLSPMLVDRNSQSSKLASDRVIDYLLLGDKTAMD